MSETSWSRRELLRWLGLTATMSVLPRGLRAQSRRRGTLVLGAGIAGIAAARALAEAGETVTVLEARHRLGGRIWSDRTLGVTLDLGGAWIHGTRGNPMAALARKFRMPMKATDYDDVLLFDSTGRRVGDGLAERVWRRYERMTGRVEALAEELERDISVGAALQRVRSGFRFEGAEERVLGFLLATQTATAAADPEELSLWYLDSGGGFGGGDRLLPDGYGTIVERLAKGLDVRLRTVVEHVEHGEQGVTVTTSKGVFRGERVLVTLPLGVLEAGSVRFSPRLPAAKRAALGRMTMGVLNKVAMRFPRIFWPRRRHFLGYAEKGGGEYPTFLNMARHTGEPILVALAGGSAGRRLSGRGRDETVREVMTRLRTMFGPEVPAPTEVMTTGWGRDPFARGAYSIIPPGSTPEDFDRLAAPVGDRLLFAGEATHREHYGTVHGAYLSGLREARRILG